MVDRCLDRLDSRNTIVTSNIERNEDFVGAYNYIDGYPVYQSYPGKINHLSAEGNEIFANNMESLLNDYR